MHPIQMRTHCLRVRCARRLERQWIRTHECKHTPFQTREHHELSTNNTRIVSDLLIFVVSSPTFLSRIHPPRDQSRRGNPSGAIRKPTTCPQHNASRGCGMFDRLCQECRSVTVRRYFLDSHHYSKPTAYKTLHDTRM
jgi:hypothetical protein